MPTPPDPERPHGGPVLEPVRVLRPRRLDGLAELMREMESAPVRPAPADEAETRELPPVRPPRSAPGLRRAAVAVAVAAAALLGFAGALLLPGRQDSAAASPPPSAATTAPPAAAPAPTPSLAPTAADPDGPGTLRQGDTGPEVTELQERLLRIPDVYRDGSTSGTYDAGLTAAVARFQLWYGITGDETGVYGDDTRRALESRTVLPDDS
ncbi:peptidoglycan-binding domain-containing protein [Streptomyces sp. NBC_00557]|uniref:peptidoglycan-binding domain-containing protein n=1 Tax=Streptomyces sp. NBC_00557 TaxID=2975776 RepID=UPI002E809799|nr:peptidoglycan-binding domain-containing protein [Streptomyces sp. NBC_00557]WUC33210.1 peptidoglycan-binding protein [Streptomyces sp. NBC_00557]